MAGMRESLRDRFDFAPGQYRPNKVRTGAIFCAFIAIFLYTIYTRPSVPFIGGGGTEVKAEFAFGANVRPGYTPVRVQGVEVGQVTDIERGPNGRGAIVTMKITEEDDVKLKQDVRMALRWRTLLGRNLYVDVDPGSPSAPKWSGAVVPRSRTQDQVELDTTLEPLDAKGRGAMRSMITEFDKAFSDPRAVRSALEEDGSGVASSMRSAARGLPGLRGENAGDLPELVADASRALGELSRDEVALGGLVTGGAGALGVTAARRADLAATLNTAPGAMRQTRSTLVRLEQTLDEVDPLADELRPGLEQLAPAARSTQTALSVLRPLLGDLEPTLARLRPALADLRSASKAGVPAFGPLNNTMALAGDKVVPFLQAKDPSTKRPNYQNIGPVVSHAGSAVSWGDRHGAVANFEATVGEDAYDSPCKLEIFNPKVPTADKVKCELFSLAAISALTGRKPQDIDLKNTSVPIAQLRKYIQGKTLLKLPKLSGKGR